MPTHSPDVSTTLQPTPPCTAELDRLGDEIEQPRLRGGCRLISELHLRWEWTSGFPGRWESDWVSAARTLSSQPPWSETGNRIFPPPPPSPDG
jgi:hypothetical protein